MVQIQGAAEQIRKFDVVDLSEFQLAQVKHLRIILIQKVELVYSDIAEQIGAPVDYARENPNEKTISTKIPAMARRLDFLQSKHTISVLRTHAIIPSRIRSPANRTQGRNLTQKFLQPLLRPTLRSWPIFLPAGPSGR